MAPAGEPLRRTLTLEAARLGFGDLRVAAIPPDADAPHAERYDRMLAEGREADMGWLAETRDVRLRPTLHRPAARSVAVLAFRYSQVMPPDPGGLTGRVASYAWGRDYHNLVGLRLKHLAGVVNAAHPGSVAWHGIDSGPAWERGWAAAAGLGFTGRNGMMILPGDTSYFFVGTLYLTHDLAPDAPLGDHCGSCRRCVGACPTGALPGDGSLDARRCISYLTIEHRGPIDPDLRPLLGRWLFGCDDCQEVCPHVRADRRTPGLPGDFAARHAWIPLPALLQADDRALLDAFEGTPLRRAGPARLRRNAAIVLQNLGTPAARQALESGLACARARGDADTETACAEALG